MELSFKKWLETFSLNGVEPEKESPVLSAMPTYSVEAKPKTVKKPSKAKKIKF